MTQQSGTSLLLPAQIQPQVQAIAYAERGQRSVDGWLSRLDGTIIATLGGCQSADGVTGSVGEIGVHHGRLFILLGLMLQAGERAFAIDLFEDQEANIDASGFGDKAAFLRNLQRFGVDQGRVDILTGNSMEVTWSAIQDRVGMPARLFSVDGGHTAEITENDLLIAEAGLADGGVIILDDYFNPEFPAVSEGTCRFMTRCAGRISPVVLGDNKLVLARPDRAAAYRDRLLRHIPRRYLVRESTIMFGQPILILRTPGTMMQRLRQTDLVRSLRNHPLGLALKPVVRRILG